MSDKPILSISTVMVGSWNRYVVARLSIVNEFSTPIFDEYLKPINIITDYKTKVTGLSRGYEANARNVAYIRHDLKTLIKGCVLIGYNVEVILKLLGLTHPPADIRDVAKYEPLIKKYHGKLSLKHLVSFELNEILQETPQDSIAEAKYLLRVYLKYSDCW